MCLNPQVGTWNPSFVFSVCYMRLLRSFYLRQKVRTDLGMEEPGPPAGVPRGAQRRAQSGRRLPQ